MDHKIMLCDRLLAKKVPFFAGLSNSPPRERLLVTRKVREGWDYKRIMTITGHKTFAVFQRYNNPTEEDLREVVTTSPPTRQNATVGKLLANGFSRTDKTSAK